MGDDLRGEEVLDARLGGTRDRGAGEQVERRTVRLHRSLAEEEHGFREAECLAHAVRHVEHRNPPRLVPAPQVAHDPRLDCVVERRQRLVQQQQRRIRDERPGERRALPFPARHVGWLSTEDIRDAERFGHADDATAPIVRRQAVQAVADVLLDRHVRKERELLDHVPDVPLLDHEVDARSSIEQDAVSDGNPARIGSRQARQAAEHGRLSGSGGAKENGDAGRRRERDLQRETRRQTFSDVGGNRHASGVAARGLRRSP